MIWCYGFASIVYKVYVLGLGLDIVTPYVHKAQHCAFLYNGHWIRSILQISAKTILDLAQVNKE